MLDSRQSIEACIRYYKIKTFNSSDGLLIDHTTPISLEQYLLQSFEPSNITQLLTDWKATLPSYTPERFLANWRSRSPRRHTAQLCAKLQELYLSPTQWRPSLLKQHHDLLSLDCPIPQQFPRRILRSTLTKAVTALDRQLQVNGASSQQSQDLEKKCRQHLSEKLSEFESEIYNLCDFVENLEF